MNVGEWVASAELRDWVILVASAVLILDGVIIGSLRRRRQQLTVELAQAKDNLLVRAAGLQEALSRLELGSVREADARHGATQAVGALALYTVVEIEPVESRGEFQGRYVVRIPGVSGWRFSLVFDAKALAHLFDAGAIAWTTLPDHLGGAAPTAALNLHPTYRLVEARWGTGPLPRPTKQREVEFVASRPLVGVGAQMHAVVAHTPEQMGPGCHAKVAE